jgi:hypothetical protein
MTSEINRHHLVLSSEVRHLGIPVALVTAPAMNKNEGWLATTYDSVSYGNTVN